VFLRNFSGEEIGSDGSKTGENGCNEDANISNINRDGKFVKDDVDESAC
jgi:hypothetical protein